VLSPIGQSRKDQERRLLHLPAHVRFIYRSSVHGKIDSVGSVADIVAEFAAGAERALASAGNG
jgi:hypothetical protein